MFADLLKRVSGNNRSQGTSKGTAETFDTESAPSLTRPLARASLDENDRLRIEINLGADASTESIQSAKDHWQSQPHSVSMRDTFQTCEGV